MDRPAPWPWYSPFLAAIGLYVGLGIAVAAIAAAAGWTAEDDLPDRFVLGATLVQDAALVALAFGIATLSGPHPRWHLGLRRAKPGRSLWQAAAVFFAFVAFLAAWSAILGIDEQDDLAQELGAEESTVNLIGVALLVCIAAPIAEELFFRGFLFGALRKPIGWIAATLVTGLVFGIIHAGGTDPVFLVPLAVLGAALCLLYKWTGSIIPGMGVHAFNNAFALGATLGWEAWQVLVALVAAPTVVVGIATAFAVAQRPVPDGPDDAGPAAPEPVQAPQPTLWLPPTPPTR
jgi:membrane protease YdiL (CAAX protease family)